MDDGGDFIAWNIPQSSKFGASHLKILSITGNPSDFSDILTYGNGAD